MDSSLPSTPSPPTSHASHASSQPRPARHRLIGFRWRKAVRDLAQHRLRTLLSVLSIGIGVFTFGMIMGVREMMQYDLPTSYAAIQPASAVIYGGPFDEALLDSVRDMPDVALASGRREIPVRVRVGENDWREMTLIVLEQFDDQQVDLVRPETGAWPPPENALLLERQSMGLFDGRVGESLTIQLPHGRERTLLVSGTVHDLNQPPAIIMGIGFGYVTLDTLPWLGLPASYDQIHLRVTGDTTNQAHIEAVTAVVEHKLERGGYPVQRTDIPTPDTHFAADFVPTFTLLFTIIGLLSLVLSAFLIINVMSAVMKQETRQIGVLKAIGARTRRIMTLYLRMVLVLGLASVLLALPLSIVGAWALGTFVAGQINFDLINPWLSWRIILLQVAVSLLVPVLAAIWPVYSTARLTVLDALQDVGIEAAAGSKLGEQWQAVLTRLLRPFSRPLRLTIRNTFRRRGRLLLTLLTLTLGGGIFMGVMTLRASLFATMEETLLARGMDVQVRLLRPYRVAEIERTVWQVAGVTAVESWRFAPAVPVRQDATASEGEALQLFGTPYDTAVFTPDITHGRWLAANDRHTAVVHQMLLDKEPYLQVGDTLTLKVGDSESAWQIVGVTNDLRPPIAPATVYVPQAELARELGGAGLTDSVQVVTAEHDVVAHERVSQALEAQLAAEGYETSAVSTASDDRAMFTERFNILTAVLSILALLVALVSSLGLMGTMTINVLERRREIGVMRAIGAADQIILRLFITEGMLIGLLSWGGAILFSIPLSLFMGYQVGHEFLGTTLTYIFSWPGVFIWLGIVLVLTWLASMLPARHAAHIRIRDTLAYE